MPSRPQTILMALLAGFMGALCWLGSVPGSLDDLFLVLRAARDPLARTDWAVLGCSSLLDIGVKGAVVLVSDRPESAAPWVGLVLHAAGCAWLSLECSRSAAGAGAGAGALRAAAAVALAVACGVVPSEAAAYQLEGPVLLLCLVGVHAALRRRSGPLLALACFGLAWARPEGVLLAVAWVLPEPRRLSWIGTASAVSAVVLWGGFLAALSPLPFPSSALPLSFHVKHGTWIAELLAGLGYLAAWLGTVGGLGAVLLLGIGLARGAGSSSRVGLVAVLLVALEGGDGYLGARLLLPALVLALLGSAEVIGQWASAAGEGASLRGMMTTLAGLILAGGGGLGSALDGARLLPSLLPAPGSGIEEQPPLELEALLVDGLGRLRQEAGGELTVVHRDQQVLRWLGPDLLVLDASGLSEPEVASLPATGAIRHGRDAFAVLADRGDVMLLDHQRVRTESWAGRSLGSVLLEGAAAWIGRPRSAQEVAAWEEDWITISLACGEGTWVNALLRRELDGAARRAGWVVDAAGVSPR